MQYITTDPQHSRFLRILSVFIVFMGTFNLFMLKERNQQIEKALEMKSLNNSFAANQPVAEDHLFADEASSDIYNQPFEDSQEYTEAYDEHSGEYQADTMNYGSDEVAYEVTNDPYAEPLAYVEESNPYEADLMATEPQVLGETDSASGHFDIQSTMTQVQIGVPITIIVNLTTTGQNFDSAVAVLEWDPEEFDFVSAEGNLSGQFLSSFIKGDQGKRILTHFITAGEEPMMIDANAPTAFATVTLNPKVSAPSSGVQLSSDMDNNVIHFVGAKEENQINQGNAQSTAVSFAPMTYLEEGTDTTLTKTDQDFDFSGSTTVQTQPKGFFGKLFSWLKGLMGM